MGYNNQYNKNNNNKRNNTQANKIMKESAKNLKDLNKQAVSLAIKAAIAVGVVGAIKYTNNSEKEYVEMPITMDTIQQEYVINNPEKVDINDLLNEYNTAFTIDEVKALNGQYSNQYIEVTGEIRNKYLGSIDGDFITLQGDNDLGLSVRCNIEDYQEVIEAKQYSIGDEITVAGYCNGGNGLSVELNECKID